MVDHDCQSGWVYRNNGEREWVERCVQCNVEKARKKFPVTARDGWVGWLDRKELSQHVVDLKLWRGDPWAVALVCPEKSNNLGTGKTRAACSTAIEWAERGKTVGFWMVADLAEKIREEVSEFYHVITTADCFDDIDLLILDDLMLERPTDLATEQIDRIIDRRYRNQRPLIVTSNSSLSQIHKRYPRVASRLSEGKIIQWGASDFRKERGIK